jgi:hypothetical protein
MRAEQLAQHGIVVNNQYPGGHRGSFASGFLHWIHRPKQGVASITDRRIFSLNPLISLWRGTDRQNTASCLDGASGIHGADGAMVMTRMTLIPGAGMLVLSAAEAGETDAARA